MHLSWVQTTPKKSTSYTRDAILGYEVIVVLGFVDLTITNSRVGSFRSRQIDKAMVQQVVGNKNGD